MVLEDARSIKNGNDPESTVVMVIDLDWRTPLTNYLANKVLPDDKVEAERFKIRALSYQLVDGKLYRRSTSGILMRCIPIEEGKELIREIHLGICGNHTGAQTLVGKAYRQGFFWPTAVSDAQTIVRTCMGCQLFSR